MLFPLLGRFFFILHANLLSKRGVVANNNETLQLLQTKLNSYDIDALSKKKYSAERYAQTCEPGHTSSIKSCICWTALVVAKSCLLDKKSNYLPDNLNRNRLGSDCIILIHNM